MDEQITVAFEYTLMNQVMRVVKEVEPAILSQTFDNDCQMTLAIRASVMPILHDRLAKIEGLRFV